MLNQKSIQVFCYIHVVIWKLKSSCGRLYSIFSTINICHYILLILIWGGKSDGQYSTDKYYDLKEEPCYGRAFSLIFFTKNSESSLTFAYMIELYSGLRAINSE
eukprot:TRINITY_DN6070_c1_g2_i1.p1 TRINITY_DN6070_c1_g2~~TRINITY_DN6070_c1_g2_i1.p1  ORF type:complete len:104 (-),score=0.67 TRINITY_DN6070_c1_g2_i1:781-1092(-)